MTKSYCDAYNAGFEKGYIKAQQQWIPCSERLPSCEEMVLVSIKSNGVSGGYMERSWYGDEEIYEWVIGEEYYYAEDFDLVEAWMPLPKPYGGESDE